MLYEAPGPTGVIRFAGLRLIQEDLRGLVRLPGGTAHRLANRDFPIDVMGKTGTTNAFRDALFVGSTYGREGITVAVRIGFDDNRSLGAKETGGGRRCRSSARSCCVSEMSWWGLPRRHAAA